MNFKEYFNLSLESRFSDREYYNETSPWRLTGDEYLDITNKDKKYHPYDAYAPRTIRVLDDDPNPPVEVFVKPSYREGWVDVYWTLKDGTTGSKGHVSPLEVSTEKDKFRFAQNWSGSDKKYKEIKDKYWYSVAESGYSISDFPHKIETKDGIDYRIKKIKNQYVKSREGDDVIFYSDEEMKKEKYRIYDITVGAFDGENIIGAATDEWGAILVTVQPDYRGRGIGSTLSRLYRSITKKSASGGYTSQGKNMARRLHASAVRDAQRLGWYDRAVRDGILTKEKVSEILKSIT